VDGIRLDAFVPGSSYEVGKHLGALFLAEGWAEPVDTTEPALVIPLSKIGAHGPPANGIRDIDPPSFDTPPECADDRRRRPRSRRERRARGQSGT
jgi:hypothetical protein